jgi:glutathione peroxidase
MPGKKKYIRLKKFSIFLLLLIITFWGWVEIVNINSRNMTGRQKILKAVYPLFTGYRRLFGKNTKEMVNKKNVQPLQSFYDLSVPLNNGEQLNFSSLKGKKVMLVNTASDCGYTAQYNDLEKLYEQNKSGLVIIGFPANDFKEQERGSDEEIAQFCKVNFGVTFPLAKKGSVIKGREQQIVFQWLTDRNRNGWNEKSPSWNFSKYLVNEQGVLTHYFDPAISPMSEEVKTVVRDNKH